MKLFQLFRTLPLVACFGLTACTGLESAVIGASATAAQSGATFFSRGKFRSFELVRFDDAVIATRVAAEKLSLAKLEDEVQLQRRAAAVPAEPIEDAAAAPNIPGVRARMVVQDDRGQSLVIVIERRSATVTMIQIDAGTFGEAGLASLFLSQTFDNLSEMGAYVDDWNRADPRGGGAGVPGS
jgi:hypothetical protein